MRLRTSFKMAERGGFEPPVPLLGVHTISSRAPSTARSPLRSHIARSPACSIPSRTHIVDKWLNFMPVPPAEQPNAKFVSRR